MIRFTPRRSAVLPHAVLLALACSFPASAQERGGGMAAADDSRAAADVRPPAPGDPAPPRTALLYVSMFLLGGIAFGVAVLPSRRTHTD